MANHDDAEIKMNQSDLKEKNVADAKPGKTLSSNRSDFLGADSENSDRGGRDTKQFYSRYFLFFWEGIL